MVVPKEILDDLGSRFLIHLPSEEKKDPTRLCFQVELAYWFYLDYYAGDGSSLPSLSMSQFTFELFSHIPGMMKFAKRTDEIIATWKQYKFAVPTFGCIIIDDTYTKVLLVQGYWSKSTWGFPKGKINEGEKPHQCATREVQEETGFDCSPILNKRLFLERRVGDHDQRLYIIPGVSRDTIFLPQTKKEIRSIRWFNICDLPSFKKDPTPAEKLGMNSNHFFMIMPFVKALRKWMNSKRQSLGMSMLPPVTQSKASESSASTKGAGSSSNRSRSQSLDQSLLEELTGAKAVSEPQQKKKGKGETNARKSLTKMFEDAAKKHDTLEKATQQSSPSTLAISPPGRRTPNQQPNVQPKPNRPRSRRKSSPTFNGKPLAVPLPFYHAPSFEIPAWQNFKLNYPDYTSLVY